MLRIKSIHVIVQCRALSANLADVFVDFSQSTLELRAVGLEFCIALHGDVLAFWLSTLR